MPPQLALFRDRDVRPEEQDNIPVGQAAECLKARSSNEWHTTNTTQRETLAPMLLHEVWKTATSAVLGIWTNRSAEDGVLPV